MTEQHKARSFAVGDMVISKEFGIGHVLNVTKHGYVDALFGSTRLTFDMQGKYEKDKPPDIITIRKPRKGVKEARDIVAMLCREYRYDVKRGSCFYSLVHHKLYRKAKSMLGDSDDN